MDCDRIAVEDAGSTTAQISVPNPRGEAGSSGNSDSETWASQTELLEALLFRECFLFVGMAPLQGDSPFCSGNHSLLRSVPIRTHLSSRCEEDMSQAIVNPEELRRFAQNLKRFNLGLSEQLSALSNQLDALNTSWRDQENRRFCEEFQSNLLMISRFLESNEQYIPFLLRKAERIEEYLQQR